ELVALTPDVIVTAGALPPPPVVQGARTLPIVVGDVSYPGCAGGGESLARPGGNATRFTKFEDSFGGKSGALFKPVAPSITRAAVLRSSTSVAGVGQFAAIQSGAHSLGVELTPVGVRDADEIERGVAEFARSGNGALIVSAGGQGPHRNLIIALAARLRLP